MATITHKARAGGPGPTTGFLMLAVNLTLGLDILEQHCRALREKEKEKKVSNNFLLPR